jgi:2-oxoglutarate dehydrogenase E2 component (dihydrolipoamide succinyltransferase)
VNDIISEDEVENISESGFLSPLVKNIIKKENISSNELSSITGTGKNNRITKIDILSFISNRSVVVEKSIEPKIDIQSLNKFEVSDFSDEVIEMTKMGKIISNHMTQSVKTSAHVQSFIEVDVTNIYNWRSRVKSGFESREGQKFTFTPIFIEAVAVALRQYPMMNISVDENKIILKKKINIGMATALSDGNLIVPVIKNADQLNLVGMAKTVNDLASRARNNNLNPDDVSGGTYTVTNVGVFGSIMGTPIINQPQVGILAFGAIRKMPSVIETEEGDYIGIRKKMIISHSYDHRVVNGALGSKFIKAVKEYLENWNSNREI